MTTPMEVYVPSPGGLTHRAPGSPALEPPQIGGGVKTLQLRKARRPRHDRDELLTEPTRVDRVLLGALVNGI
jgi:hypothetical protein